MTADRMLGAAVAQLLGQPHTHTKPGAGASEGRAGAVQTSGTSRVAASAQRWQQWRNPVLGPTTWAGRRRMTHFQSGVAVMGLLQVVDLHIHVGLKLFKTGRLNIGILFSLACKPW